MDITQFSQINPPQRLLMGPGPINADPRVLRAMSSQLVGQYDPAMTHYMNEVMALYRGVFRTENRWTMLVDGTSRAGIEAILLSAIRPGDKVLVPVFGRFGHLLCEIARRCRAEVHTIEVPWGEVFKPDQVEDAIKRVRPRLLLTVQGDTSTTMLQPLAELGEICRRHDVLFYTDATASLGGNPLETDAWQLDAVSAGMQKCLIAASFEQLKPYIDDSRLSDSQREAIFSCWPGPVTFVFPARPETPRWLTGRFDSLAVRVTNHPLVIELCEAYGKPLVSTSANLTGQPPCRTTEEVHAQFGDSFPVVDGATGGRQNPSEIRDALTGELFRQG